MHIKIDRDKCIAAGCCVIACPEVFSQDAQGVAVLLTERIDHSLRNAVVQAADDCPARCIEIEG